MMDGNIHITGFMGVGKSTVARDLAKYLVWDFVDLDHEVEALSHRPMNDVTEKDGLKAVRQFEERALQKITEKKNQVIALGAGTLLNPENMKLVKSSGLLIYLSAEIKTLIERLVQDTSKERPLFGEYVTAVQTEVPRAEHALERKIASLLRERLPTYVKADLKIDTDEKSIRAITIETEKRLRLLEQRAEFSEAPKMPR
jgi:shikimate kinase